jgi:hypothetical protein
MAIIDFIIVSPSICLSNGNSYYPRIKKGTIRPDLDDWILLLFNKGVTSQFDEYAFGEMIKYNFELSESIYEEIEATIEKMIVLLKKGMGC